MTCAAAQVRRPGDARSLGLMDCPVWAVEVLTHVDRDTGREHWETFEGFWFTDREAAQWCRANEHRFHGQKFRVYGRAAHGELREILKAHTEAPGVDHEAAS